MGSSLSTEFVTISPRNESYPLLLKRKEYKEESVTADIFSYESLDFIERKRIKEKEVPLSVYLKNHIEVEIALPSPRGGETPLPQRCPIHITDLRKIIQEYAPEACFIGSYGFSRFILLENLRLILIDHLSDKGYVKGVLRSIVLYGFIRDLRGVRREIDGTILFIAGLFDAVLSSLSLDSNVSFRDFLTFIGIRMERGNHTGNGWVKEAMYDITILHAYSSEAKESETLPEALIRVCTPSVITSYISAGADVSKRELSLSCMSLAVRSDRPKHVSAIFKRNRYSSNCNIIMREILLIKDEEKRERFLQEAVRSGLAMCDVLSHVDDEGKGTRLDLPESTRRIREYVERHCILLGGMREGDVSGAVVTLKGGVWYHQFLKTSTVNIYRLLYILHSRFPTECSGYTDILRNKADVSWYPVCTTHDSFCDIIENCSGARTTELPKGKAK